MHDFGSRCRTESCRGAQSDPSKDTKQTEEVLLQAAQICNVFMQEEYDEQVSVVE